MEFDIYTHEFDVAFSFPGEYRDPVKAVVDALSRLVPADKIFYDKFYEAFLAMPSLDTLLQDIYRNRTKLNVVFLCEKYQEKEWCGLEARAIRELIKKRQDDKIMLIRMDDGAVEGFFETDGWIDMRQHEPAEIADLIYQRLTGKLAFPASANGAAAPQPPAPKPVRVVTRFCPVTPSPYFLGRDTLIADIEDKLSREGTLVLLNGLGGIGKSEICRELFRRYLTSKASPPPQAELGWVTFHGDLSATLFGQFTEIPNAVTDYMDAVKRYTQGLGDGLLLFVDNANDITERDAKQLTTLGCRVILTSREALTSIAPVKVGSLSPEDCRKLYRKSSGDTASPDGTLDDIIGLANRHTLAVMLLARTQEASGRTAGELLEILRDKGFDLTGIEEWIPYVHNPEDGAKPGAEENALLIEHMSKVFDIADFDLESEERRVLRLFSLLAAEPVPREKAREWFDLPNLNALNKLVKRGWIARTKREDGSALFSMHPVVSDVVRKQKPPDREMCGKLVRHLAHELHLEPKEVFTAKLPTLPHARSVAKKVDAETADVAALINNIGGIYDAQGDYAEALEWGKKAMAICEKVKGKEYSDTAATYNNIGLVYDHQGDYAQALKWHQKALAICEKVLDKEDPDIAVTYNNIGLVYDHQGDYAQALAWCQKALAIDEKVLDKEDPDIAVTYNNIGLVYDDQGDSAEALKWYRKALAIREKVLDKEDPDIAVTYNSIGHVYDAQGDSAEALAWYQKALAICEKMLSKEHYLTATTYNNIAVVYDHQGDYAEALEYCQKALSIFNRVLGPNHPHTKLVQENLDSLLRRRTDGR